MTFSQNNITIFQAITGYFDVIERARSQNTLKTYQNALNFFANILAENDLPPAETSVNQLNEDGLKWLLAACADFAPATERLYLTATLGFYKYLAAENLLEINLPLLQELVRNRARRAGRRLPQFPRDHIDNLVIYVNNLIYSAAETERTHLINLRDRALIITLADTGLRIQEACSLRRGDIDWQEGRAVIVGKGDQEAVVRFSRRALETLKDYISARAGLDGSFGKPLTALPLFARHDDRAGNRVLPISTTTGRNIVKQRVREALGEQAVGSITPHSFRHYFVTMVLRGSGGNLKLAQELARHKDTSTTQLYAHLSNDELDQGYFEIFDQERI
jgi:site-specific recombinase XerD